MDNMHKPYGLYERMLKRPFDIFCSSIACIAFFWLYIVLAILVRIKLGSPVLFIQNRVGKDGKVFKMYKFRTMTNARNGNGKLLPDELRYTKFGKLLRSTSLDEIPEIFNILKGDMSVVGPRPLLVEYLPYYNEDQKHRHDVRPGLSGYAQVHGRNAVSWDEKFKMDVEYVNHITFITDVKIIFNTIQISLKREGINPEKLESFEDYVLAKKRIENKKETDI